MSASNSDAAMLALEAFNDPINISRTQNIDFDDENPY